MNHWRIDFEFLPIFERKKHFMYRWLFRIFPFYLNINDLSGQLVIFNVAIKWAKVFR